MATSAPAPDWLRLQRKIFSRWVKLKVAKRNITCNDVVTDISDGILLLNLLEVLSEKKFTEKYTANPKMRPQKLDNVSNILKFVWSCGVEMKLKPSPEDLVDGNEKSILGLIWAIMLKYIKIGDEDEGEQLNAKDALLLWLQNKTASYNLTIEKFGKDLHNGMILCALIHKHRPKLIPYETLNPENKTHNLQLAMDAALKYFNLEKYLTPEDIPKLDENSMVIYISEYYYGIAEQMKLDLAARRISKVIKLTEENDALKAEFNKTGERFLETLKKVEKVLEDRTIDNTMAGAKKRLEDFYSYKTQDKNVIIGDQLNLEAIYNTLAMKLSHNKRPEYIPPKGLTLKDMESALHHLEECEQERSVALHAELNRQIKLVQLDEQHKYRYDLLKTWITEKEAYLKKKEHIDSVSGAQLHIRLLDAYDKESAAIFDGSVNQLLKLGQTLLSEKYERSGEVQSRDNEVSEAFKRLGQLSKEKRPVLEDDLAREQFKEKVRLLNKQHIKRFEVVQAWIEEKEAYLKTRESINSVAEARTQLSLLDTYEKDKSSMTTNSVAQLKKLGAEILAKKYETKYSSWVLEEPEKLRGRESTVDTKWHELSELSAEKKRVLDDHLAREEFKEKVRLMNANHVAKYQELQSWVAEKENYLNTKESIDSIAEAQTQISVLEEYEKEKVTVTETNVAALKHLGADILAQKYETKYSKYVFEHPNEIKERESNIDSKWQSLSQLSASKLKVLEADLAREIEKERLRLEFAHLASEFTRWTKDTSDNASVTHFGFTLEEVQAFQQVLNKSDSDYTSEANSRRAEYTSVWNKLKELHVTQNIYTSLTPDDLAKSQAVTDAALHKRKTAYETELARQLANDALCKQFASLADPFSKWIIEQKDTISQSKKDLEEQLNFVQQRVDGISHDGAKLPNIKSIDEKMKAAGITNNRHTTLTLKDLEVQWEQYQAFLHGKQKMLKEEIEHAKLRGITPEQFKDIEDNFKQFDKDKSGNIDRKELKALLYSLGEEKTAKEITDIMSQFGKNGKIPYEGFKEFMIGLLGDSNTKEEIVDGFVLINRGDEVASVEKLDLVMNEHDVDYIKKTAPKQGEGYNYKAWTNDVFSR